MTARTATARRRVGAVDGVDAAGIARRLRPNAWILLAAGVIAAFFVLIQGRLTLDRSAFEIQRFDARIEQAEAEYWELRLEVAELQDPARIETLARELGMEYPTERLVISVAGPQPDHADIEDRWAELKVLLSAQP